MAGIFSVDDIPAWMNPTRAILETGQQTAQGVGRNFSEAFTQAYQSKKQEDLLKQKQTMLQNEQTRLANKALPIANALKDAKTPEESWNIVSQNPTWLADPDTAQYVAGYLKTQSDVAKAQVGTIAGKVAIADSTEFAKRSAAVDAETRAGLKSMQPNPDGTPSPQMWQALNVAEQAKQLHEENLKKQAEIDALQRGDVQTTTIGPKGVTQTFKPAGSAAGAVPQEATLSDGSRIVYNPKTGAFKFSTKQGAEKELTSAQLLAISEHLLKVDAEDPNGKKIRDFLAQQATAQIGGGNAPTNTEPGMTSYSIKVGRFLVTPK